MYNICSFAEHEKIAKELDVEKSQLLGGDVENTHFVKGLDRTLLKKMREQIQAEEYGDSGPSLSSSSSSSSSSLLAPGTRNVNSDKMNVLMTEKYGSCSDIPELQDKPLGMSSISNSNALPPGMTNVDKDKIEPPMNERLQRKYKSFSDVPTHTLFGSRIKGYFMQQEMRAKEKWPTQMKKDKNGHVAPSPFALMAYEYKVKEKSKKSVEDDDNSSNVNDEDCEDLGDDSDLPELPTIIRRSKQEVGPSTRKDLDNYIIPKKLLDKIGETFSEIRKRGGKPRKKRSRESTEKREREVEKGKSLMKQEKKPVVDTVGDIFADVGKYDPNSAIERAVVESEKVNIFGGLRAASTEEMRKQENKKETIDDADIMIRRLSASSSKRTEKPNIPSSNDTDPSKIHRDVIGGEVIHKKQKELEKRGQAFLKGSYDHNNFENPYDDDDDDVRNDSDDERAVASSVPGAASNVGNKDQNWAF